MSTLFSTTTFDAASVIAFLKDANVVGADVDGTTDQVTLHVDEGEPDVMFDLTPITSKKVDKVVGKELSSNDYTDAEKVRLAAIQDQVQADWDETNSTHITYIQHKPTLYDPPAASKTLLANLEDDGSGHLFYNHHAVDSVQADWDEADNTKVDFIKNKPTLHTHANKPVLDALSDAGGNLEYNGIPVGLQSDWTETTSTDPTFIKNKPILYDPANQTELNKIGEDGDGKLTYGGARVDVQSDWNQTDTTKEDYIRNKPAYHSHANLTELSKIDEDGDGDMTYKGQKVTTDVRLPSLLIDDNTSVTDHAYSSFKVNQLLTAQKIGDHADVTITTPVNKQTLVYDSGTGIWKNGKVSGVPDEDTKRGYMLVSPTGTTEDAAWSPVQLNPQSITEDVDIPSGINAVVVSPFGTTGTITVANGSTFVLL